MAEGISRDRLEELSRTLYYPAEGEPSSEEIAEARDFVETTLRASQESPEAKLIMERYLGIISREDAISAQSKLAAQRPAEAKPEVQEQPATVAQGESNEELIEELRIYMIEDSNIEVSKLVADHVFGSDEHILYEAAHWGAGDTVVREAAHSVLSQALIGRRWPMNKDLQTPGDFDDFLVELKIGHDALHKDLLSKQAYEN